MDIQKIFEMIQIKNTWAVGQKHIRKPLAYALYKVWQYVEHHEKERDIPGFVGNNNV